MVIQPKELHIYYPNDQDWNDKYFVASTELHQSSKKMIYIGTYILKQEGTENERNES